MINKRSIPFAKYSGTGNDFILIDNRKRVLKEKDISNFTQLACELKTGIGADGVILLEESRRADFKMRIINADGSEPEMCGNGARCITHFANIINCAGKKMEFETLAGLISGEIKSKDIIRVKLTRPFGFKKDIKIKYKNRQMSLDFINTSVPHVVIFTNNIRRADVFNMGRFIRNHRIFKPAGTNANFVQIRGRHNILVRTYERGVEDETFACGTGAVASAIVASELHSVESPVKVRTHGGGVLTIYFKKKGSEYKEVFLEGGVKLVYEGGIDYV